MFNRYRENCLALIPIRQNSKAPIEENWQQFSDRLPVEAECDYWEAKKYDRYGLVCGPASNIIVIDIDSDDKKVLDACPPSPVRKRGRKGESRFFQYNQDIPSCKIAGCIDILSRGKQTLVPPTIHPDTNQPYVWMTDQTLEDVTASELPHFTVEMLNEIRRNLEPEKYEFGESSSADLQGPFFNDDPKRLSPHGSHDRLKRIVTAIIARGASPDEAVRELLRYDEENHKPSGYFSDNTRPDCFADPTSNALFFYASNVRTFNKRLFQMKEPPSVPLISGSELIDITEVFERSEVEKFQSKPWPKALGILKDLQDYIISISKYEKKGLALGGALAIASTAVGNKMKFKGAWSNLYVINVAASGEGKEAPYSAAKNIFRPENGMKLLGSGGFRSSTSMIKDLMGQRTRLDLLDESGGFFKSTQTGGSFQQDMMDVLTQLWSASNSVYYGPQAAEREQVVVDNPCVSILFSIQPSVLKRSVNRNFAENGFLPRCLIFNDDEYGSKKLMKKDLVLEKRIIEAFMDLQKMGAVDKSNLISPKPMPVEIVCDVDAEYLLEEYDNACDVKKRSIDPMDARRSFVSRYAQIVERIALISGALNEQRITLADVEFAIDLIEVIEHNSSLLMPQLDTENQHDANSSRILSAIKERGIIKRSELARMFRFLKSKELDEITKDLEISELIKSFSEKSATKPTVCYQFLSKK